MARNTAAKNAHATSRANSFTSALLKDHLGNTVVTYPAPTVGTAAGGSIELSFTADASADYTFQGSGGSLGSLVLQGAGGIEETLTAGGPGSGADVIVQNTKAVPDGEVYDTKAVPLTATLNELDPA